jgi:hypothetical protein
MTSHTRSKFERGRLRQGVDRNQGPAVKAGLWDRPALQQSAAMRDSPVRQFNQRLRVAALGCAEDFASERYNKCCRSMSYAYDYHMLYP